MAQRFRYGGELLSVATPEIVDWCKRLNIDDILMTPEPPIGSVAYDHRQWPPKNVAINRLYWPAGEARYGFGLFLATKTTTERILAAGITAQNPNLNLEMGDPDDQDRYINVPLKPVHCIPVSAASDDDEPFYILALVDDRYYTESSALPTFDVSGYYGVYSGYEPKVIRWQGSAIPPFNVNDEPGVVAGTYISSAGFGSSNAAMSAPRIHREASLWTMGCRTVYSLNGGTRVTQSPRFTSGGKTGNEAFDTFVNRVNDKAFPLTAGYVYGQQGMGVKSQMYAVSSPRSIVMVPAGNTTVPQVGNSGVFETLASAYGLAGTGPTMYVVSTGGIVSIQTQSGGTTTNLAQYQQAKNAVTELYYSIIKNYVNVTIPGVVNPGECIYFDLITVDWNTPGGVQTRISSMPWHSMPRYVNHTPSLRKKYRPLAGWGLLEINNRVRFTDPVDGGAFSYAVTFYGSPTDECETIDPNGDDSPSGYTKPDVGDPICVVDTQPFNEEPLYAVTSNYPICFHHFGLMLGPDRLNYFAKANHVHGGGGVGPPQ